jgi:hypothetical protein
MFQGEMFRYAAIDVGPRISRPKSHFYPGQYLACRVDDDYIPGRLLEVIGRDPAILKICMDQGRTLCGGGIDGCESSCPFRLLTTADNGAVLTAEDIIFGALDGNPAYRFINRERAEEIFDLIGKLEKRQKR